MKKKSQNKNRDRNAAKVNNTNSSELTAKNEFSTSVHSSNTEQNSPNFNTTTTLVDSPKHEATTVIKISTELSKEAIINTIDTIQDRESQPQEHHESKTAMPIMKEQESYGQAQAQPTQTQAVKILPSDVQSLETLSSEAHTAETPPSESKVIEASLSETKTLENTPVEAKIIQVSPSETQATETSPNATTHTEDVSNMFGTISKHYDLLNHVLSFGVDFWWRHRLVNSIVPGSRIKVLDMAAGTLDVSLALLRKYPQSTVIAGDICEPMLKYGENKIRYTEKDRIECQVMDAQEIPYANESFDAVTIAFGIRNVEDRIKALKEMNRVLVTGGQLCILEFSPLTMPFAGKAYHWYLENILPKIAKTLGEQEDAYKYLAETIKNFPNPQIFSNEIREAGFNFIRHEALTCGIVNLYVAIKS